MDTTRVVVGCADGCSSTSMRNLARSLVPFGVAVATASTAPLQRSSTDDAAGLLRGAIDIHVQSDRHACDDQENPAKFLGLQ